MDVLLFLLILAVLIIQINYGGKLSSRLSRLEEALNRLTDQLKKYPAESPLAAKQEVSVPKPEVKPEPAKPPAPVTPATPPAPVIKPKEKEAPSIEEEVIYPAIHANTAKPAPTPATPKEPQPGFFERNPDLEKFVGENLVNKIGIAVLVLGIGFFVKYAIDKDWINEIGRVVIGIVCGGALLGLAHYLRRSFTAFSSVLVGGGIAVLYLTIAIAFHEYELFSQPAAFGIMVVITAFAVALSVGYDRVELAVLALLGGFAAPFMVSTGEGNYIVLFTYIIILDTGMLVLAYFKKWNLINLIAYFFTILLFGPWVVVSFDSAKEGMIAGGLSFATAFYLIFFLMTIVWNIKQQREFKPLEFTLLLSNTFLYYGAGMHLLDSPGADDFKGLFTALLAVFNFGFVVYLKKRSGTDKNLVFLLIGLVLTFLTLAAPVQLEGNYITLFWAGEAVLLLWLSQKSGINLMRVASVVITALMVISLVMDWEQIYSQQQYLMVIFNKGYLTSLVSLASLVFTLVLLKRESALEESMKNLYWVILILSALVVCYTGNVLELRHQLYTYTDDIPLINTAIGIYNVTFVLALILGVQRYVKEVLLIKSFALWGPVAMLAYFFYYHPVFILSRDLYLNEEVTFTGFGLHYVFMILLIILSVFTLKIVQSMTEFNKGTHNLYAWVYVFFYLFIASAELDHTVMLIAFDGIEGFHHILSQNHKIGYPILWGIGAFIIITVGLKSRKKHLRIISLVILGITLAKLFLYDIRGISEGGKIAAFISLGVLLLVVSFMYQKLKRLLLTDEPGVTDQKQES